MSIAADRKERLASMAGVVLLHVLLGWALLMSLAPRLVQEVSETLGVFNVREMPPSPPIEPIQPEVRAPVETPKPQTAPAPAKTQGAAAPPAPPPAAPRAVVRDVPLPVAAGIVPSSGGEVTPLSGQADWVGRGSGSGGQGSGTGSGTAGSGTGGGGTGGTGSGGAGIVAARAKLRGGKILPADYPRAAGGAQGVVEANLSVNAAGVVTGCRVTRSSGNKVLDDTTCRLIRERFRFAPALDSEGRAIADVHGWRQRWWRD